MKMMMAMMTMMMMMMMMIVRMTTTMQPSAACLAIPAPQTATCHSKTTCPTRRCPAQEAGGSQQPLQLLPLLP